MVLFSSQAWKYAVKFMPEAVEARQKEAWNGKNDWHLLCFGKPQVFVDTMEKVELGWQANLIFPGSSTKKAEIHFMHHCFVHRPRNEEGNLEANPNNVAVAGIEGVHYHAPFKTIRLTDLLKRSEIKSRRRASLLGVPTLEAFRKCKSPEEFEGLRNEGDCEKDFEGWPSHFWVDPTLFFCAYDGEDMDMNDPAVAAMKIIVFLNFAEAGDDKEIGSETDTPGDLLKQAYPLLKFLWGVANGVFGPVEEIQCPWSDKDFADKTMHLTDHLNKSLPLLEAAVKEGGELEEIAMLGDPTRAGGRKPLPNERDDENNSENPSKDPGDNDEANDSPDEKGPDDEWDDMINEDGFNRDERREYGRHAHREGGGSAQKRKKHPKTMSRTHSKKGLRYDSELESEFESESSFTSSSSAGSRRNRSRRGRKQPPRKRSKATKTMAYRRERADRFSDPSGSSPSDSSDGSDSSSQSETRRREARRNRRDGKESRSRRGDKEAIRAIAAATEIMAQSQAKFLKEQKATKSFFSHLLDSQKALFRLLNVKRMEPGAPVPKMSEWAKRIDRGTRPRTIVDNIRFEVREMGGEISESGFTSFITSGFYNPAVFDQPGGFTTLMFRPKEDRQPMETLVERKRRLRELFGAKHLSEPEADLYTKQQFYIADTVERLVKQLKVTKRTAALLTRPGSIATEVYSRAINLLTEEENAANAMFRNDRFFCVRVLYMVDVIQNRLFKGMMDVAHLDDPYGAAIEDGLDRLVRDSFHKVFGGFSMGSLPRQALPSLFVRPNEEGGATGATETQPGPASQSTEQRERRDDPSWFRESNDPPPSGIALPEGKTYANLFANANQANARDWPRIKHHTSNAKSRICIRYLTTGRCARGGQCILSHQHFNRLENGVKQEVKDRLQRIYGA